MRKSRYALAGFVPGLIIGAILCYVLIQPEAVDPERPCPEFKLRTYLNPISGYRDTVRMIQSEEGFTYPEFGDSLKIKKGDIFYAVAMAGYYPRLPETGRFHLWPEFSTRGRVNTLPGGESALIRYETDTLSMNGEKIKKVILPARIKTPVLNSKKSITHEDSIRFFVVDE